jgi:hypothetical protein
MAEKVRKQILSNETLNAKGFHVLNGTIDWNRYRKNPILLRNPNTGEHYGEPIGKIKNIRLEGGNWIGELVFGSSPVARQAQKDYDDGILNGVSIFGIARIVERNNRRVTTLFDVWEISLVNIPANPDAVAIREGKEGLSVSFDADTIEMEEFTALSAKQVDIINQFETNMTENEAPSQAPEEKKEHMVALDALADFLNKIGLAPRKRKERVADDLDRDADQDDRDAGQDTRDAREDQRVEAEDRETDPAEAERREEEAKKDERDAAKDEKMADKDREEAREERASALSVSPEDVKEEKPVPTALSVGDEARVFDTTTQIKTNKSMVQPFFKYIKDSANASKIQRIAALSASADTTDGLVGLSAETDSETLTAIQELAASMKNDSSFMVAVENMTFQVNDGRKIPATETIEALASGHGSAQFIQNADLAKINWLSLFVRQLFPENRWADRVRRMSVRDREGIIWIESAMNPEVYFGDRAPVNAKNYLYDDMPRGLARKVLSLQPILWQSANTDVLSYNDVATGTSEATRIMTNAIHNYWLQKIAEDVPAANQVPMSGTAFASTGRFPINPAAAGNLAGLTLNDLLGVQGRFLARNLEFGRGSGVTVLAEPYYTALAQTEEVKSILTQQLSNARPDGFTYSGFEIIARSIIAGYNTATNTVVDAEKYFDKSVDWATGAIDDTHVSPVLASTVYDIGLSFIPEEVVVGIGNTNIHMVSDPNSYGWKMSMDISTAAGTLRSSAAGIALLRPTTAA